MGKFLAGEGKEQGEMNVYLKSWASRGGALFFPLHRAVFRCGRRGSDVSRFIGPRGRQENRVPTLMGVKEDKHTGGYEAVQGKLVLIQEEPEEIPLKRIARIEWDDKGKSVTIQYRDGVERTTSAFVGIMIVNRDSGNMVIYNSKGALKGAVVTFDK